MEVRREVRESEYAIWNRLNFQFVRAIAYINRMCSILFTCTISTKLIPSSMSPYPSFGTNEFDLFMCVITWFGRLHWPWAWLGFRFFHSNFSRLFIWSTYCYYSISFSWPEQPIHFPIDEGKKMGFFCIAVSTESLATKPLAMNLENYAPSFRNAYHFYFISFHFVLRINSSIRIRHSQSVSIKNEPKKSFSF